MSSGCPWMWDNLTCWRPARIGEVVVVNCPELFIEFIIEEDHGQLLWISYTVYFIIISTFKVKSFLITSHVAVYRMYCVLTVCVCVCSCGQSKLFYVLIFFFPVKGALKSQHLFGPHFLKVVTDCNLILKSRLELALV